MDSTFWMALAGAVLGGLSFVLHIIAPLTKNTIDDKIRDGIDVALGKRDAQ